MNKKRLLALAAFLDTVPEKKFNIASWRMGETGDEHGEELEDAKLLDTSCGTCGCAIGWACAMHEFQAQGFIWAMNGPGLLDGGALSYGGWDAVREFFDIDEYDARLLFSEMSYVADIGEEVKPWVVAERIRKVVAGEEA